MPDIPKSPPTFPVVPWGPGSSIGVGSGVLSLVAALVDAVAGEGVDADTRTLIISGVAALVLTSLGRMFQAGLAYLKGHGVNVPTYEPPSGGLGTTLRSERGQSNPVSILLWLLVAVVIVVLLIWLLRSV
jgi:hypothetical protein